MNNRNFYVFILFCGSLYGYLASDRDAWYKGGNFYQIYPRSLKDSDGDGVGDLNGIASRLEHLKEIGVDGVWLSPIYKSPMVDFGYDISDFRAIQPEYGTMNDFERLADKCKKLGIRLILDFVPNHTSDQHEWFIASSNKSHPDHDKYKDFYIWHQGKKSEIGTRIPPSNWLSNFRFSAWKWIESRGEYYLHQFAEAQPDLNYRNPNVVNEMKDVLRFWMGKGVSGFRVDTIPSLFEVAMDKNGDYPDEPLSGDCKDDPESYCYLKHIYTYDQNETYDMVYQWREVLEEYKKEHGGDATILMTEAYSSLELIQKYYGDGQRNGSQIPFNFYLLTGIDEHSDGARYHKLINDWLDKMPAGVEANWVLGNHDQKRLGSRLGEGRIDIHNILLKTLPGISVSYQGEEIGMTDTIISWEDTKDPQACNTNETIYHSRSRDPARTPFQWDEGPNAGFGTKPGKKTWLPVNVNYKCINVKTEKMTKRSYLNVYKRLVKLRKEASLGTASFESVTIGSDILAYKRTSEGNQTIFVVLNLGKEWKTIDLKATLNAPKKLKVIVASIQSQYTEGMIVKGNQLTVPNDVGLVLGESKDYEFHRHPNMNYV